MHFRVECVSYAGQRRGRKPKSRVMAGEDLPGQHQLRVSRMRLHKLKQCLVEYHENNIVLEVHQIFKDTDDYL
eukprot:765438-Hanusia_phi.AAC.1